MFSGRIIFNFGIAERLRTLRYSIFTGRGYPFSRCATAPPRGSLWVLPGTFPPPLKPSPAGGRWRVAPDEGQHPLALLHPLSQALSGLPALPLGELARERLRGRAPPSGELAPQVTERVRAPNKNSLCISRCRGSLTLQAVTYSCTYPDSSSGSRRW